MIRICRRGSLTVEAALTLPVFMTGLLTLVSSLYMCLLSQKIQASLLLASERMAVAASDGGSADIGDAKAFLAEGLSEADVRFIYNGIDGMDLSGSEICHNEYINLKLFCSLVPFSDAFGIIKIPLERRCLTHIWCGYDRGYFGDGEYVYITEDSKVYHCDRNCRHLMITVRETSPGEIATVRNESGARYRPCEHCHPKLSDEHLYITPQGDRYHNQITCSGLKRSVRRVRKSEAEGRRPCSRCGR
ncbi:MAG: hypothetical protein IJI51_06425 [Lachnospiraceae bacterium]|nr:hypothetical protein [Lachnospiraceae bacterium]